jgi:hypothetical protein
MTLRHHHEMMDPIPHDRQLHRNLRATSWDAHGQGDCWSLKAPAQSSSHRSCIINDNKKPEADYYLRHVAVSNRQMTLQIQPSSSLHNSDHGARAITE